MRGAWLKTAAASESVMNIMSIYSERKFKEQSGDAVLTDGGGFILNQVGKRRRRCQCCRCLGSITCIAYFLAVVIKELLLHLGDRVSKSNISGAFCDAW